MGDVILWVVCLGVGIWLLTWLGLTAVRIFGFMQGIDPEPDRKRSDDSGGIVPSSSVVDAPPSLISHEESRGLIKYGNHYDVQRVRKSAASWFRMHESRLAAVRQNSDDQDRHTFGVDDHD